MNSLHLDKVYQSTWPSYKHQYKSFIIFFVIISFIFLSPAHAEQFKAIGTIDAYFSPRGGTTEAVVKEINSARTEIMVQAYSFTSTPIAKALVDARKRGVKIEVILDRSQKSQRYSSADFVAHTGILTYIDSAHAIAHNKIMIVDRDTLITGSFNFTKAAEMNNAENLLIMKGNKPLVERYIQNFNEHMGHSERYYGK
jgi:phosphatidylserine/phosphatidylglycerophosphate/cardiolipin synthase-like enzyme